MRVCKLFSTDTLAWPKHEVPLVLIFNGRQKSLDPVSMIECKGHGAVDAIKKEMEQILAGENLV